MYSNYTQYILLIKVIHIKGDKKVVVRIKGDKEVVVRLKNSYVTHILQNYTPKIKN